MSALPFHFLRSKKINYAMNEGIKYPTGDDDKMNPRRKDFGGYKPPMASL